MLRLYKSAKLQKRETKDQKVDLLLAVDKQLTPMMTRHHQPKARRAINH